MEDHSEDERLENKAQEPEKNANETYESDNHTDELEGIKDFVMTDDEKTEFTIELKDMPDEEEPSDIYSRIEDIAEQLDNPENSPTGENTTPVVPDKKIELTEADYADVPDPEDEMEPAENYIGSSDEKPEMAGETADNMPETVSESGEAHTSREKPDIPAPNKIPEAWPTEALAAPSTPRPRTGMATAFGLLGILGASGALWVNSTLSDRIDQLETQPSSSQEAVTVPNQSGEIALLNRRMDTLETTVSSLMKDISKQAPAVAARTDSSDLPVIPAAPVKPVIADVKIPSGNDQGIWVVNLVSLNNAAAAVHELERMKRLGIPAENVKAEIRGKTWYRIRVPGFASAKEANRQRKLLATKLGIQDTWIGKR